MNETPELAVTLEAAEAYFAARPLCCAWANATDDEKQRALAFAALLLNAACRFTHEARYDGIDGVRRWRPRIVAALCEQARWTLQFSGGSVETLAALGVARADVGGISATFRNVGDPTAICSTARRLIGRLGVFDSRDDGAGSIDSSPLAL